MTGDHPIAEAYLIILQTFGATILPQTFTKQSSCHNHLISNDSPEVFYLQAIFSEYGLGVPINRLKSLSFLRNSLNQSLALAQSLPPSFLTLSASAYCDLGYEYLFGSRVNANPTKAFEFFTQGLTLDPDHSALATNLAYCYLNGLGVDRNPSKAFELYLRGALQGNPSSQHNVGYCLQYQVVCGGDFDKTLLDGEKKSSIYWYRISSDSGSSYGQFRLGYCYQYGLEGLTKDMTQAMKYYHMSANHGNSFGQYCLAYCHHQHLIPNSHYTKTLKKEIEKKAFDLYLDSSCQGNPYGLHGLGQCFQHGIGVKKNITESNRIYSLIHRLQETMMMSSSQNQNHDLNDNSSSHPHLYYPQQLVCHTSYHPLSSSQFPDYSLLTIHRPHYLWEVIGQFGYQPFYSLLVDYSDRGCLLSSGFLLQLLHLDFFAFVPTFSDETTLQKYHELTEQIPVIISEFTSLQTLQSEDEINDDSSKPFSLLSLSSNPKMTTTYLIHYLTSLTHPPPPLPASVATQRHPRHPHPSLHQLSHEELQLFSTTTSSSSSSSQLDIFPPALFDFCLQHFSSQNSDACEDVPITEYFQRLPSSPYLPARLLAGACFMKGLYGYEKNRVVTEDYSVLCQRYGVKHC
jgi:TPR repeat protein